jgi:pimeloyl-ACP methyl ester carboxylesterase
MIYKHNYLFSWFGVFILILQLNTACSSTSQIQIDQPETGKKIDLVDCQLSTPELPIRLPAKCGSLTVLENPNDDQGRTIQLHLAVIPAVSRKPVSDPLFFITGGPGQAATQSFVTLSAAFEKIQQNRDIVLVDQRGTGGSHPLNCPLPISGKTFDELSDVEVQDFIQNCLANLNADPRYFTTPFAVDDLDTVREALGYDQINLYGISYGTRVALTYLRQHAEHVRTVILDGVVPNQSFIGLDAARDAQDALDSIFARCAAEVNCHEAFPYINDEFKSLLAELDRQPIHVNLSEPSTGEPIDLSFSREMLGTAIRLLSYTPETAALLPLLIHKAEAEGDYTLLAADYLLVTEQVSDTVSNGLNYAVLCSEDAPFISPNQAGQANAGTYLGNLQTDELLKICASWPKGELPGDYKTPVNSDVPVLLLSGEDDPVTPPENAELASQTLNDSLHIIAPGQGHGVINRGCISQIATKFVDTGTNTYLNTGCVQEIKPLPFFINFSGSQP